MALGSRPPRVAELAVWGAQPTQDIRLVPTWHHWAPGYLGKVGSYWWPQSAPGAVQSFAVIRQYLNTCRLTPGQFRNIHIIAPSIDPRKFQNNGRKDRLSSACKDSIAIPRPRRFCLSQIRPAKRTNPPSSRKQAYVSGIETRPGRSAGYAFWR